MTVFPWIDFAGVENKRMNVSMKKKDLFFIMYVLKGVIDNDLFNLDFAKI
jgi:hypothetical protein